jgi:hypothetical protein
MNVHQISKPIAPERAQRSEASQFHDQLQLATKTAVAKSRLATVSADGGGRNPGSPSLYPGGNSTMPHSWSYAPVHHDVADAATQSTLAQVETQDRVVQDAWGWEQSILDAQQRQAEQQDGWERTTTSEQQRQAEAAAAAVDAALDAAADEAAEHFSAQLEAAAAYEAAVRRTIEAEAEAARAALEAAAE